MIARRYLLPGRGEAFIALVASISLIAVMLGVAALVVVMSVMNGFRAELFDKIVGLNGHAVVQGYGGKLRNWQEVVQVARATPGITSATPIIEQPLFATYNGRSEFILVRGMQMDDIRATPTDHRQCQGRLARPPRARRRDGGDRLAPRREPRRDGRKRYLDHQSGRGPRHRSARCRASSSSMSARSSRSASMITTRRS
jgi:hypothetical protein